jgi:vacuolar-type H+-ATPase subunit C/Vma6
VSDFLAADARARGLGLRLFRRAELDRLAGAPDVSSLVRTLGRSPQLAQPIEEPATVARIELAIRQTAARHLALLGKWDGAMPALTVFYAAQDRRALRAMLRGAIQGAPSDARLGGLLPTPDLPERALVLLARQPSPSKIAAHLVVLRHPYAERLSPVCVAAHPALLDLELALVRAFADRIGAAARQGDANLVAFARERIDVCNLQLALLFVAGPRDVDGSTCFVEGGRWLERRDFALACAEETRGAAGARLGRALAGSPLSSLDPSSEGDPARLEHAALVSALARQRAVARVDPLGSAPLLGFLLRLEAQSLDLLRVAWGASLGAPAELVRPELATPWN